VVTSAVAGSGLRKGVVECLRILGCGLKGFAGALLNRELDLHTVSAARAITEKNNYISVVLRCLLT
jgi:hypothetical protein